jgi:hypothetical protein
VLINMVMIMGEAIGAKRGVKPAGAAQADSPHTAKIKLSRQIDRAGADNRVDIQTIIFDRAPCQRCAVHSSTKKQG